MRACIRSGTYQLKEDLFLVPPAPLPVEGPIFPRIPNPLSTTPAPPTQGVKISPVYLQAPEPPYSYYPRTTPSDAEHGGASPGHRGSSSSNSSSRPPVFGEWNRALSPSGVEERSKGKDGLKRAKPKTNIVRSTSTYVSRVQHYETTPRRLAERPLDGPFAFVNVGRSFQWLDMAAPPPTSSSSGSGSGSNSSAEPFVKILFASAHMLCHDVNEASKTTNHIDLVMGSSTSDILWYEPMSQRYTRINKNGSTNSSPVLHIQWIPRSERLFMAAHADGSLIVYDKAKESNETFFTPDSVVAAGAAADPGSAEDAYISSSTTSSSRDSASSYRSPFRVLKSVNSPKQTKNPIALYKLSSQPINDFAFSPDERHVAAVLEDGTLRVIDLHEEKCLDVFHSYYGGLMCVCWSPDGKYIVTGGQDDLVSIWSFVERRIVARCQGHTSWVQSVAFDPWRCELEQGNYRFGSVGDDCRLCLWDFSPAMLHRSRVCRFYIHTHTISRLMLSHPVTDDAAFQHGPLRSRRTSVTTQTQNRAPPSVPSLLSPPPAHPVHSEPTPLSSPQRSRADPSERAEPVVHPAEKRASTAQLPPILVRL